ncbi:MAG: hypothetical protein RLY16_1558 [Bacteroidota bacterium]
MKNLDTNKAILWDFDGVIFDSMPVRDFGFMEVLKNYPQNEVAQLMEYHRQNGGLSRYVKFRYFFEVIRHENVTDEKVQQLANQFSAIMRAELIKPQYIIQQTLDYIKKEYLQRPMHIISGSDENELKYICMSQKIDHYFLSIHGSPTAKPILIREVMTANQYKSEDAIYIGDSINDYHAATSCEIPFLGFNNLQLMEICGSENYIYGF